MKRIIYILLVALLLLLPNIVKADSQIIHSSFHNMKIKSDYLSGSFLVKGINYKFSDVELLKFIEYSLNRYIEQLSNPPSGFTIIIQVPKRKLTEIECKTYNNIDSLIRNNPKSFSNVHVIHLKDEHYIMVEHYWSEYNKKNKNR